MYSIVNIKQTEYNKATREKQKMNTEKEKWKAKILKKLLPFNISQDVLNNVAFGAFYDAVIRPSIEEMVEWIKQRN